MPVPSRRRSEPQPGAQAEIQPASSRIPRGLAVVPLPTPGPPKHVHPGPAVRASSGGRLGDGAGPEAVEDHVVDERGRARRDLRRGDERVARQLRVEEEAAVVVGGAVRRGRAVGRRHRELEARLPRARRGRGQAGSADRRAPARGARPDELRARPAEQRVALPRVERASRLPDVGAATAPTAARAACGSPRAPRRAPPPGLRGRARCGRRTARCRRGDGSPRRSRGRSARRRARSRESRGPPTWRSRRRGRARPGRPRRASPRARPPPPGRRALMAPKGTRDPAGSSDRSLSARRRCPRAPGGHRRARRPWRGRRAPRAARAAGSRPSPRPDAPPRPRPRRRSRRGRRGAPASAHAARARSRGRAGGARRPPARPTRTG